MSEVLRKYIATRDRRVHKKSDWQDKAISDLWAELYQNNRVTVGGRSSAGAGSVDISWVIFTSWNEVVAKAKKLGYAIDVHPVNQDNGWATKAGGFWYENTYVLNGGEQE